MLAVRGLRQQGARSRNQQSNKKMSWKAADVRRVYMRQNILDKYGRTARCLGCAGNGKHTESAEIEFSKKWWTKVMQLNSRHLGNQEEIVPQPDVSLKKRKWVSQTSFQAGRQAQRQTHPRGENLSKDPVRNIRVYWRGVLQRSTRCCATRHLSTSAEIALQ